MGKIVISMNATLDGVVQDPDGQEGFALGGWFHQSAGARDFEDWAANETQEAREAEALLLGRRSFEWFQSRLPAMGERVSREWAGRMNTLPKYVVSSRLEHPEWSNTIIFKRDAVEQIERLKRRTDGEILVYGSQQLVRALVAHELADQLRLIVFPIMLATGQRLFDGLEGKTPLRLVDVRRIGEGLVRQTYDLAPATRQ